jgi:tetratricopeptide (TPR) repeat protein
MKAAEELYNDILPLMENNWRDAAISALGKLLEQYPDFAVAHNDLGIICADTEDQGKALFHLRKAVDLEPENVSFQMSLADYYYIKLGEYEESLEGYKKVLSLTPDAADVLFLAGNISVFLNRFEDARMFYSRIPDTDPLYREAADQLEKLNNIESDKPENEIDKTEISGGIMENDLVDNGQMASEEEMLGLNI